MKIEILNEENIYEFLLPKTIEGSFWICDDENPEQKLINIEASNNEWIVNCTEEITIISEKIMSKTITLKPNSVHKLDYNGKTMYMCVSELSDNTIKNYSLPTTENYNITIGSKDKNDICYKLPFVLDKHCEITKKENGYTLKVNNGALCYVNGVKKKEGESYLLPGSIIYIFGLKILITWNFIQINNFANSVNLNAQKFLNVLNFQNTINQQEMNNVVKERNFYNDNDYFFKAPRIKRFVETYELNIDPPPAKQEQQEMPILYVIGPMLATATTSTVSLANALLRISKGEATFQDQWTTIVIGIAMLSTTLIWPNLTKRWQKRQNKKKEKLRQKKYTAYINEKREKIEEENALQKSILIENLTTLDKCRNIILKREIQLWERKIEQKDFLMTRLGIGDTPLDIKINYQESDFVFEEDELKKEVTDFLNENKTLTNVPVGYSFKENPITAIMGEPFERKHFINNILLQLMTFHSYDDLKLIIFTNKRNSTNYDYLKILPHNFSNDKTLRFFADNSDDIKEITDYLMRIFAFRKNAFSQEVDLKSCQPYFLIITDVYDQIRKNDFLTTLIEEKNNYGFSLVILENRLGKLPSNCNSFINLTGDQATILKNDSDTYKQQTFTKEIQEDNFMYQYSSALANIPIEFADDLAMLPDSITFLDMFGVTKIEQLNSLNRWRLNNPVKTLKTEIGVNENGEKIYLDLHEKYHGPHGLVAGMTGSGKSEFIITYVLSMVVNYSPNEVAFVLIDYKGGGLAGAFDNKGSGLRLPHLAGTITNLDKAEMNRSLASIESELKRRQSVFNDARNQLGESTIDIYKYQKFYREGKLKEPIPHLVIICDEFAELKTQQPEFMENLISAARIGRSLGVHLILATQKPSGVVDAQIWSNTKFRVCLKVQDKSDSNEMLKRPDAAELKQVGRFYLQVGYNEMFLLGQSGYAGAKYYPSDTERKEIDKSINIINNIGNVIATVDNEDNIKTITPDGEQLAKTLEYICNIAKRENTYSRKLWLDAIPQKIFISDIVKKYQLQTKPYFIEAVIGEYDNPNAQLQNIYTINLTEEGNTIIYGINGSDKEMALNSIIYSTCAMHTTEEINFYIVDYGSESMRIFNNVSQIGDMVFLGETEKMDNLFKFIDKEIIRRKKLFVQYSGKYTTYIANSGEKLPLIVVIINDYDTLLETNTIYDDLILQYSRDGQRYGIVFILTVNAMNAIRRKIKQNFQNEFCLQLNSSDDYVTILGRVKGVAIPETPGRGLMKKDEVFEFQTAMICEEEELNEKISKLCAKQKELNYKKAAKIPVLPNVVTGEMLEENITTLNTFPIGISKNTLNPYYYDFTNASTVITALETEQTKYFTTALFKLFKKVKSTALICIDCENMFESEKELFNIYKNSDLNSFLEQLLELITTKLNKDLNYICIITGVDKLNTKIDSAILENIINQAVKTDNFKFIIISNATSIRKLDYESWYRPININSDGIWIGNGIMDQNTLKVPTLTKEMKLNVNDSYGWIVKNNNSVLIKLVTDEEIGDNNE